MPPKKYKFIPVSEEVHNIVLKAKHQQSVEEGKTVTFDTLLSDKFKN